MKKKNELGSLAGQLGKNASRKLPASSAQSLIGGAPPLRSASLHPSRAESVRSQSLSSTGIRDSGIRFGSPSSRTTATSRSSDPWSRLVTRGLSGGVANAFGAGSVLSIVTGLGGLISGLVGLFGGGKKTPPPLQHFELPDTQNDSISISAHAPHNTSYSSAATGPTKPEAAYANGNANIPQAVKLALLHSSSLNDIIAEL